MISHLSPVGFPDVPAANLPVLDGDDRAISHCPNLKPQAPGLVLWNGVTWVPIDHQVATAFRRPFLFTDFCNTTQLAPFAGIAISSGTIGQSPQIGGQTQGVARLSSGTTANSGYRIATDNNAFSIKGSEYFRCIFSPKAFANTTVRIGFHDTATSSPPADGLNFEYSGAGSLAGVNRSAGGASTTATSLTLSLDAWYEGLIVVNANATRVDYYVFDSNGSQLWTDLLTTNIPVGSNRNTGAGVIATNSGTTSTALIDLDLAGFGNVLNR